LDFSKAKKVAVPYEDLDDDRPRKKSKQKKTKNAPDSTIAVTTVNHVGEDWEGLKALLQQSNMAQKDVFVLFVWGRTWIDRAPAMADMVVAVQLVAVPVFHRFGGFRQLLLGRVLAWRVGLAAQREAAKLERPLSEAIPRSFA
jgi:hypothetical protein